MNAQHADLLGREALKLDLPRFGPSAEADILLREASSTSTLRTAMFAAEGGGLPSSLRRATGPEARVGSAIAPATARKSDVQQSRDANSPSASFMVVGLSKVPVH